MGYLQHAEGVSREWLEGLGLEIEVAWERVPATAQLAPWYDPGNARIRS